MIALMQPVAEEMELREEAQTFSAVLAAAGSLFDKKAAAEFAKRINVARREIRTAQARTRGLRHPSSGRGGASGPGPSPAAQMLAIFGKLGLKTTKGKGRR